MKPLVLKWINYSVAVAGENIPIGAAIKIGADDKVYLANAIDDVIDGIALNQVNIDEVVAYTDVDNVVSNPNV
jgi:hypothetical protein